MDDGRIIELYWARSEQAIEETAASYGRYLFSIAYHILNDSEDAEESVSDTYVEVWNRIPPQRPVKLSVFLGRITRSNAIDRWRRRHAGKRGGGQIPIALEELADCIPAKDEPEQLVETIVLTDVLNRFLASLSKENRIIFMQRYWYLLSIKEIAEGLQVGESKVKMTLLRARNELKALLEKEEIIR